MDATVDRSPLIGRELELARSCERLDACVDGRGAIVLVSGEPGIGKTKLVRSALEAARTRGLRTAFAANFEHVRAPFGPFVDVLRALEPALPSLAPAAKVDRASYERFLGRDAPDGGHDDKRRLFVIVAESLQRAAARTPIAIAFDDAQWFDPESTELLQFLAPRIDAMRVVVVLTVRNPSDDENAAALLALDRYPSVVAVSLGPLDDESVRGLVATRTPVARRLSGAVVDEICRRSDGNPLFASELVREALRTSDATLLPVSLQASVAKRVTALPAPDARVIEAASVLGREFHLDTLAAILDAELSSLIPSIRAARDAGLLAEARARAGLFGFAHELVRVAIYDRLLAIERAQLHRRYAELLEQGGADGEAALLAFHWLRGGDPAKAARYAERAGDAAMLVHAHASARDFYCEALTYEALDDAARARLHERVGEACHALGDEVAAATHLEEAIAYYRNADVRVALRLELEFAAAAYRGGRGDDAIAACERVLSASDERALRFEAHAKLALYRAHRYELDRAREQLGAADALDVDEDKPPFLRAAISLEWARVVVQYSTRDQAWITTAQRALELAEASSEARVAASTLMNFSGMARARDRRREADDALERAIALGDRNGLVFISAYARCEKAEALYVAGNLGAAYRLVLEVAALHVDALMVRIFAAAIGLFVLGDMERLDALPALADPALLETALRTEESGRVAPLAAAHAHVASLRGETQRSQDVVRRALDVLRTTTYNEAALFTFSRTCADDDVPRVAALLGERPPAGPPHLYALLTEAQLAKRTADENRVQSLALLAVDAAERADARLLLAEAYDLAGRPRDAARLFEAIGATARLRRYARRDTRALTRREAEIAALVARGLSNRAIAEQLVLSERTVEHHIAAAYEKLGYRSRSELIARYDPSAAGTA